MNVDLTTHLNVLEFRASNARMRLSDSTPRDRAHWEMVLRGIEREIEGEKKFLSSATAILAPINDDELLLALGI